MRTDADAPSGACHVPWHATARGAAALRAVTRRPSCPRGVLSAGRVAGAGGCAGVAGGAGGGGAWARAIRATVRAMTPTTTPIARPRARMSAPPVPGHGAAQEGHRQQHHHHPQQALLEVVQGGDAQPRRHRQPRIDEQRVEPHGDDVEHRAEQEQVDERHQLDLQQLDPALLEEVAAAEGLQDDPGRGQAAVDQRRGRGGERPEDGDDDEVAALARMRRTTVVTPVPPSPVRSAAADRALLGVEDAFSHGAPLQRCDRSPPARGPPRGRGGAAVGHQLGGGWGGRGGRPRPSRASPSGYAAGRPWVLRRPAYRGGPRGSPGGAPPRRPPAATPPAGPRRRPLPRPTGAVPRAHRGAWRWARGVTRRRGAGGAR